VRDVTPPVTPETRGWWDATRERRLTVQRCAGCTATQLYPRARCTRCHGDDVALVDAAGTGVVHSFTVVHRSPDPEVFPAPYVVALVRLDEGPLVTTGLVDVPDADLRCELPVRVVWEALPDGRHLPLFTHRHP
jgi:uncharacterized OB-fold protein